MITKSFTYKVLANVEFKGTELQALMELSAQHYDGVCKAAGKPGGFLYGWINRYLLMTEQFDKEPSTPGSNRDRLFGMVDWSKTVEIECNFHDLDVLAKIAEGENCYRMIGNMPLKGNFGLQLSQILRSINNETLKVNKVEDQAVQADNPQG